MENLIDGESRSFSFLKMIVGLAMCVVLIGLFLTSFSSTPINPTDS